jgi:hypothetical protein
MYPERVQSMILGGAILKMNFRSQVLMRLETCLNMSYHIWCYINFFAFVIMPKKVTNRVFFFINEAKNYTKEFIKWFKLTAEINPY